jgi:hypothetical protein
MKILLVGANSFLGKSILEVSRQASDTDTLVVNRCNILQDSCSHEMEMVICTDQVGNILSSRIPQIDAVYLLSTVYTRDPGRFIEMIKCNIDYLSNIIINFAPYAKKFIYANSYMSLPSAMTENSSFYAKTKSTLNTFAKLYLQNENILFENIHIFDLWGSGDKRRKFPQLAIEAANQGSTIDASSGQQYISPLYVADAAKILLERSLICDNNQIDFQLQNTEWIVLRDLMNLGEQTLSVKFSINWGSRPNASDDLFIKVNDFPNLANNYDVKNFETIIQNSFSGQIHGTSKEHE